MIAGKERHERAKNFRDMISAGNYGRGGTDGVSSAYGVEKLADPIEGKD